MKVYQPSTSRQYYSTVKTSCAFVVALLAASLSLYAQAPDVFVHFDGQKVYLRWRGVRTVADPRYVVYREVEGMSNREKVGTELTRTSKASDIREIAGTLADAYLGLYKSNGADLSAADYQRIFSNKTSLNFFNAMAAVTPAFARVLGELTIDSSFIPAERMRYSVVLLQDGVEKSIGTSRYVSTDKAENVPLPINVSITSSDAQCTLFWDGDAIAEQNGEAVSRNVYRAEHPLGPFIRINAMPLMPISFGTDAKPYSFTDEFLQNGKTYYYYLTSVNVAGVQSLPSVSLEGKPHAGAATPSSVKLTLLGSSVMLEWDATLAASSDSYYEIQRRDEMDSVLLQTVSSLGRAKTRSWLDNSVVGGNAYSYVIRSIQSSDTSDFSTAQTTTIPDLSAPSAPDACTFSIQQNRILLSWKRNSESDLLGYDVERMSDANFSIPFQLTSTPLKQNNYTDTLPSDAQYRVAYVIYAIDKNYNRSLPSERIIVRLPDKIAPSIPVIIRITKEKTASAKNSVQVHWAACTEPDVKEYLIYKSINNAQATVVAKTRALSYSDSLLSEGEIAYSISAIDSSGNESARSDERHIRFQSPIPDTPTHGIAVQQDDDILLTWQGSSSSGVVGYGIWLVEENGAVTSIKENKKTELSFVDKISDTQSDVVYHIRAFDAEGNLSPQLVIRYSAPKK